MIFACVRALFSLAAVDFAGDNSWVIGGTQLDPADQSYQGQCCINHRLKPDSLWNQTFVARKNSCDLASVFLGEMILIPMH